VSETPRPLPGFATWPTFPFEGDIRLKKLEDPVPVEPTRHGEDPAECRACSARDEAYIWVSEHWRVRSLERPTGLPMVLILESRSHLDLGDLPNMLAAELGLMTVRLERAIRSLDGVARVHVNRWGDGSAHLHLWFLARPYGLLQLRGTFLSMWDDILPAIPERQWRENLALVAEWLAGFDGQALAEPPRIDWKAPAAFAPDASPTDDDGDRSPTGTADPVVLPGGVLEAANETPANDNPSTGTPANSSTAGRATTTDGSTTPGTGAEHSTAKDGGVKDGDSGVTDAKRNPTTPSQQDDAITDTTSTSGGTGAVPPQPDGTGNRDTAAASA
jgi:hypothetical protein